MSKTPYRLSLWLGVLALLAEVVAPHATLAGSMPSRTQIRSDMTLANTYFLNKWPTPGCTNCLPGKRPSNIWTRGTYFEGVLAFYRITQDPAIYNYAVQWGTFHNWALRYGDTDTAPDSQCAPQSYIELYQFDTTQTNRLTHAVSNANYWVGTNRVNYLTYVDAIHMSMPMFAKLGPITGNTNYAARMYSYFNYAKSTIGPSNGLYNTTDHLWWRDTNFLANYVASDGTTQKCYWSRGNGWAFVALARIMDVLPTNDAHYAEYRQTFQDMAVALKAVQRLDGFWNVNLGYTNDYPGPETSGTAMFTYGLAWGINKGYLDINTYLPAVINGWNALATGALHHDAGTNSGFLGYVQSTGDRPASGQPVTYDSVPNFEDYALGAFLLAGSQVYALNALPVITNQPAGGSVNAGQTVTLSVGATGNPAPAYQWRKDGVNVSGATTPTLILTNVQVTDAGSYTVAVTNLAGGATSTGATVNVLWTFAAYQQQYFTAAERADPTVSGPTADPDHDGVSNLEEYGLGLNPRQPDAASTPQAVDITSEHLTLTFIRRNDVGDLDYVVEVSDDLFGWDSGPEFTQEVSATALDAQRDRVTVQDLTPTSAAVCRFMRVRLEMQ